MTQFQDFSEKTAKMYSPGEDMPKMTVNPVTLAFTGSCADLENAFPAIYAHRLIPQVRLALILGCLFYGLFGILDAIIALDMQTRFAYIRYGIVCPSIIIVFFLSFSARFFKYMQAALVILIMISGSGIIYMTIVGNLFTAQTYYIGIILILTTAYTFTRIRFIWATPACWLIVLIYLFTAHLNADLSFELVVINTFFCITANIIGMLVCYALEYYVRRDFFQKILLDRQHKELEASKMILEEKVQQRTAMLAHTNEELRREIEAHQRLDWEKKALEDQLRQAQKMEAVGTLAGGIAHDFNNILAAILGHTELASMQLNNPEKAGAYLSEVLKASDRAKDLVGQILAFSRQSDKVLKPMQPSVVTKEALRLLEASLPKNISIRKEIHDEDSIIVADATQVHQILMNLCTNAAQAMAPDGGVLTVALRNRDIMFPGAPPTDPYSTQVVPGKYVCLSVSDTGPGIPAHLRERIFDPYFTTKAKDMGTGLGLAVVRGIVQSHNGIIDLEEKNSKGTTFHILLPRIEGHPESEFKHLPMLRSGNERILLVDDEAGLAELGAKLLTTLGYRVVYHTDPKSALSAFKETPDHFDLIFTDMMMPELSGEQLSREILLIRPDIPIIVYSGFSENINQQTLEAAGIKKWLRKPITIYGLSLAIRQVLDTQKSARQSA
jgi:signal transduction histidine kinase/ActR/RegA family two-component response regulator